MRIKMALSSEEVLSVHNLHLTANSCKAFSNVPALQVLIKVTLLSIATLHADSDYSVGYNRVCFHCPLGILHLAGADCTVESNRAGL